MNYSLRSRPLCHGSATCWAGRRLRGVFGMSWHVFPAVCSSAFFHGDCRMGLGTWLACRDNTQVYGPQENICTVLLRRTRESGVCKKPCFETCFQNKGFHNNHDCRNNCWWEYLPGKQRPLWESGFKRPGHVTKQVWNLMNLSIALRVWYTHTHPPTQKHSHMWVPPSGCRLCC